MSRVIQLAKDAGLTIGRYHRLGEDYVSDSDGTDITEELESFYHAARAEALREIATELDGNYAFGKAAYIDDLGEYLRAMADREGK